LFALTLTKTGRKVSFGTTKKIVTKAAIKVIVIIMKLVINNNKTTTPAIQTTSLVVNYINHVRMDVFVKFSTSQVAKLFPRPEAISGKRRKIKA
jgi:hypothetical protein